MRGWWFTGWREGEAGRHRKFDIVSSRAFRVSSRCLFRGARRIPQLDSDQAAW